MNKFFLRFTLLFAVITGISSIDATAQEVIRPVRPTRPGATGSERVQQTDQQGRTIVPKSKQGASSGRDSLQHRDNTEDSITISFRYFDSTRVRYFDSSINDFTVRYPIPATWMHLGNVGTAARSLIFNPNLKPGFDPGFHSFDIYRFKIQDTRFFQTTRPFTELGYLLGGSGEQLINVLHSQNIRPNFNMALQYRLINSPGNLQNQNTNHSSYRINGNYQSRNKRYTAYGIYLVNKLGASENGGIQNDSLLNDFRYTNRFLIPTRLSGQTNAVRNPFNSKVITGNVYSEKTFLYRHQYDLGQSDSLIVNDSTVIRLFYPRLRFQHTFTLSNNQFEFRDDFVGSNKQNDYRKYFNLPVENDTFLFRDKWNVIQNDFSIISFPEKNNLNQFIKAGATVENISGTYNQKNETLHNIFLNGEYRNRTRNQKWDIEAIGNFYVNGYNNGDYSVAADLKRILSKKLGSLRVGFQNVNRTASLIFNNKTSFPVSVQTDVNKENWSRISGSIDNEALGFSLFGDYYLVSNYSYFDSFFTARQESTIFNVLHLGAKKKFQLTKRLTLYSEIHLQKTAGNPPVQLPLIYTANRLVVEGVYAKNMNYAIGLEVRYHTPYKADNYSPFLGQFFYQDNYTISNRPEVNAFFNFRIKRFSAFVRTENLNTFSNNAGGFGFNKNNLAAQYYPQQGLWIRLGIFWTFIN